MITLITLAVAAPAPVVHFSLAEAAWRAAFEVFANPPTPGCVTDALVEVRRYARIFAGEILGEDEDLLRVPSRELANRVQMHLSARRDFTPPAGMVNLRTGGYADDKEILGRLQVDPGRYDNDYDEGDGPDVVTPESDEMVGIRPDLELDLADDTSDDDEFARWEVGPRDFGIPDLPNLPAWREEMGGEGYPRQDMRFKRYSRVRFGSRKYPDPGERGKSAFERYICHDDLDAARQSFEAAEAPKRRAFERWLDARRIIRAGAVLFWGVSVTHQERKPIPMLDGLVAVEYQTVIDGYRQTTRLSDADLRRVKGLSRRERAVAFAESLEPEENDEPRRTKANCQSWKNQKSRRHQHW